MPTGPRPPWPVGVARVAVSGTIFNHRWVNVFYVQLTHTNPVTVNDLKTLADQLATSWLTQSSMISSSCSITQVDVSFIPSTGNVLDYTGTYASAGSGGAAVADAGACWVVNWVISDRYRGGHPRMYIPGVLSADVTNGSDMSGAHVSTLAANAAALRNTINALTSTNITAMSMGTVRYQSNNNWLSPPLFRAYTSVKVNPKLGSQRRRVHS